MGLGRIADAGVNAPILPRGETSKAVDVAKEWGGFSKGTWLIIHCNESFHLDSKIATGVVTTIADPWYPAGVFHYVVDEDATFVGMFSATAGALGWVRVGYVPR